MLATNNPLIQQVTRNLAARVKRLFSKKQPKVSVKGGDQA